MPGIKITINDKALNAQISKSLKQNPLATSKAVTECVLDLAGESARRAPIESGDLRNNCHGKVQGRTVFENQTAALSTIAPSTKVSGSVGYSLPYALRQHEDMSLRHDQTDGYVRSNGQTVNMVAGGEAKYLEAPFNERKARYIKHIKEAVLKNLG